MDMMSAGWWFGLGGGAGFSKQAMEIWRMRDVLGPIPDYAMFCRLPREAAADAAAAVAVAAAAAISPSPVIFVSLHMVRTPRLRKCFHPVSYRIVSYRNVHPPLPALGPCLPTPLPFSTAKPDQKKPNQTKFHKAATILNMTILTLRSSTTVAGRPSSPPPSRVIPTSTGDYLMEIFRCWRGQRK